VCSADPPCTYEVTFELCPTPTECCCAPELC
jgi:hypothetical protein